jgi:MSHA biogenesis protein MshI
LSALWAKSIEGLKLFNWARKKVANATGLIGIESAAGSLALAHAQRTAADTPRMNRCLYSETPVAGHPAVLKGWVEAHSLAGGRVNLVLPSSAYQLLLVDCPDVDDDELRDAIRWRVRDLITEPLENVVIDAFTLPTDAYRGRSRMAYCAVMSRGTMQSVETLITDAGLQLHSIDIREMAFRNLGLLAGAKDLNIALLRLSQSEGLITIQHGPDLYMARRIEQGLQRANGDYSGITLEIQRSLDYFESQLGKGYLNRLLLAPAGDLTDALYGALSSGLAVNLQQLDLSELVTVDDAQSRNAGTFDRCLVAIGAALRQEAA